MFISQRAKRIAPSPTLAASAKAKQMQAEGIDVVNFGAGEPDFDTPQHIKDAAIKSLLSGFTKYTPTSGTPDLKKAICAKLARDNGLEYEPSNVIVSLGAKHSIYNAVLATVEAGDEVIILSPYWVSYPEIVGLADAKPVYVETDESTGFTASVDQIREAVTPRTRMLILNSPSNPTGGVYDRKQIEQIAELAVEKGFYVLSDEIYEKIIYDGREHVSIASLGPEIRKLTITVNGFSKAYSMTGWRLGYAAAEKEIVAAMDAIQSHSASNMVSFTMPAAVAALEGPQDVVDNMVAEFDRRRRYVVDRLNSIEGISCATPGGAFYVFPNVSGLYGRSFGGKKIDGSAAFEEFALDEAKIALVAGHGFGADKYVRLSYATSMANIEKGLDRLEEAVKKLT
ncbi:MAG: pyridoxal phosphate-dependent aminotransferase [Armatimonadetes bacterium]|nr:pyridoxal phosphate-dependent aminotransferase [Armatimonadota bacterium]